MKFIIHNDSRRFAEIEMPLSAHSSEYTAVQEAFAKQFRRNAVDMIRIYPDQIIDGIAYDEELAGPNGMNFLLIALPETSDQQIAAAKAKLRQDRDVCRLSTLRLTKRVEFDVMAIIEKIRSNDV